MASTLRDLTNQTRILLQDMGKNVYTDFEINSSLKNSLISVVEEVPKGALEQLMTDFTGTAAGDTTRFNVPTDYQDFISFQVTETGVSTYDTPWDLVDLEFLREVKSAEGAALDAFETSTKLIAFSHDAAGEVDQFEVFAAIPDTANYRLEYVISPTTTGTQTIPLRPNLLELCTFRTAYIIARDPNVSKKYSDLYLTHLQRINSTYSETL